VEDNGIDVRVRIASLEAKNEVKLRAGSRKGERKEFAICSLSD